MAAVIADSALQFFPFLEKCENFRLKVEAMGCIQREDGKLEMPIDNAPSLDLTTISLDDYLKQMHAVK